MLSRSILTVAVSLVLAACGGGGSGGGGVTPVSSITIEEALNNKFGDDLEYRPIGELVRFLLYEKNYKLEIIDDLDEYEIDKIANQRSNTRFIIDLCSTMLEKGYKSNAKVYENIYLGYPCQKTIFRVKQSNYTVDERIKDYKRANNTKNCLEKYEEEFEEPFENHRDYYREYHKDSKKEDLKNNFIAERCFNVVILNN